MQFFVLSSTTYPLYSVVGFIVDGSLFYVCFKEFDEVIFTPAGLQPLHAAAIAGHSDVVQILVEHGADANSRHRFAGNSPLQLGRPDPKTQTSTRFAGTGKWPPISTFSGTPLVPGTIRHNYTQYIDLLHLLFILFDCRIEAMKKKQHTAVLSTS